MVHARRVGLRLGRRSDDARGGGTYVLVPRGNPYTFGVVRDGPTRWTGIFSPAKYVRLIQELGLLLPGSGPPDPVPMAGLFREHETEIVERTPR